MVWFVQHLMDLEEDGLLPLRFVCWDDDGAVLDLGWKADDTTTMVYEIRLRDVEFSCLGDFP